MISIHALREEGDLLKTDLGEHIAEFLSTPSARRATRMTELKDSRFTISIHALREEGDNTFFASCTSKSLFLSTPSARRATGFLRSGS